LDPAEDQALPLGSRRGERVGGRFRCAGERLDLDHLGAQVLERGAGLEVAVPGLVHYPGRGGVL
jgi:hypothetical protein